MARQVTARRGWVEAPGASSWPGRAARGASYALGAATVNPESAMRPHPGR